MAQRPIGSADFLAGVPVPVNPEAMDRELSRLWKPVNLEDERGPSFTRACLSNIIFHALDVECCARANELVQAVGRRFPSRMILLRQACGMISANGSPLSAAITAVCHPSTRGGPPICCEQITLAATDRSVEVGPMAAISLLVPDLPVNLVLLSSNGLQLVDLLSDVLDRVIFDSRELEASALTRPLSVVKRCSGPAVDDLAWRDTIGWRMAVSEIFDEPVARDMLSTVRSIEFHHAEGSGVRAALLGGWFGARLNRDILTVLVKAEGPSADPGQILSLRIDAGKQGGGAYVAVRRVDSAKMLHIEYHTEEFCVIPRTMPLRTESSAELLGGALERTTHQAVLRESLERAVSL